MGRNKRLDLRGPIRLSDTGFHALPTERLRLAGSSPPRDERPLSMSELLRRLDSAIHLDRVVHDLMACLERRDGPVGRRGPGSAARFLQLLEHKPAAASPVLGPPVLCGSSPPIGMESVLGMLGSRRHTGILRAQADDAMYMVSVVRGDVVHGVSNPRPESELLGNVLLSRGAIDGADLVRFFERCGPSAFKMGEALGRQELVGADELRAALEQQLQLLFDRLLSATSCEWCFHEGEATLSFVPMRMNLTRVLLESARKHDEGRGRGLDGSR